MPLILISWPNIYLGLKLVYIFIWVTTTTKKKRSLITAIIAALNRNWAFNDPLLNFIENNSVFFCSVVRFIWHIIGPAKQQHSPGTRWTATEFSGSCYKYCGKLHFKGKGPCDPGKYKLITKLVCRETLRTIETLYFRHWATLRFWQFWAKVPAEIQFPVLRPRFDILTIKPKVSSNFFFT